MTDYIIRTIQFTIAPAGEPVFSEMATQVTIVEEAAEEWRSIKMAVDTLLDIIKKGEKP